MPITDVYLSFMYIALVDMGAKYIQALFQICTTDSIGLK